jgi:hypothetical protein
VVFGNMKEIIQFHQSFWNSLSAELEAHGGIISEVGKIVVFYLNGILNSPYYLEDFGFGFASFMGSRSNEGSLCSLLLWFFSLSK